MTKMKVNLTVNGQAHEVEAEPRQLLIHLLREDLNLTGPHIGCETSHCGACTIEMDGKSVKACTVFAAQAQGADITTGMTTRAHRLLQENPTPTEEDVRFGMAGNLCRCTGYQNIVKSIMAAATELNSAKEAAE